MPFVLNRASNTVTLNARPITISLRDLTGENWNNIRHWLLDTVHREFEHDIDALGNELNFNRLFNIAQPLPDRFQIAPVIRWSAADIELAWNNRVGRVLEEPMERPQENVDQGEDVINEY